MDVNNLLVALDNETNETILGLSTNKILRMNLNILKELELDKETTLNYLKKLKGYRYIDELSELKYGAFIKWIPITDPNYLPLNYSGMICDINITDKGVFIKCKNFMHRHYTFKMDECLIFQKLTSQEMIILSALDHLDKTKEISNKSDKDFDNDNDNDFDTGSEDDE